MLFLIETNSIATQLRYSVPMLRL